MLLLEMSSIKLLFLGSFVLHGAVCFFFFFPRLHKFSLLTRKGAFGN